MPLLMCPNCNAGMQEVIRHGVQLDMCPQCRGVWLDRGELEKLLSSVRAAEAEFERGYQPAPQPAPGHHAGSYPGHRPYDKRKKSMFGEIFDIFD